MRITTKQQSYELLQQGFFGNRLRMWDSFEDVIKSEYTGTVSMRYKGLGGGFYAYEVPPPQIPEIERDWISKGADRGLITFNESAPDHLLLIQGEVMRGPVNPYSLFYSLERKKMREALKNGKQAEGLTAKLILEHFLYPSSYEDMQILLNMFPEHAIEFSTYSVCLGDIPGRNTVIWEVRQY